MFKHLLNLAKAATRTLSEPASRSPEWPRVERLYRKLFPACAACGSSKRPQVHHMKSFSQHPELELDPTNLITLCMDNDCHLYIGHLDNFKITNTFVVEDSAKVLSTPKENLVNVIKEIVIERKASPVISP